LENVGEGVVDVMFAAGGDAGKKTENFITPETTAEPLVGAVVARVRTKEGTRGESDLPSRGPMEGT